MKYRIEHIRDFLNVPEERWDECLLEFKEYLKIGRQHLEIMKALSSHLKVDMPEPELAQTLGAFTWIDDGKKNITLDYGPMGKWKLREDANA